MKNSKEDTLRQLQEEYLKDKSEEKRREFFEKPFDRRYSAVMAWKRRLEMRGKQEASPAADVAPTRARLASDLIKDCDGLAARIEAMEDIMADEMARLQQAVDAAKDKLNNFYRIRNARELRELERTRDEIQQRIDHLRAEGAEGYN